MCYIYGIVLFFVLNLAAQTIDGQLALGIICLAIGLTAITGTFQKSGGPMMSGSVEKLPGYALLAAIVQTKSEPWFFKAVGPEITINYWCQGFEKFVKCFHYQPNP